MSEVGSVSNGIQGIGVIGAGAWGTTLAKVVAEKGYPVHLWAYESHVVEAIRSKHENSLFLPGVQLPRSIVPTGSLQEALNTTDCLVFAVPSQAARSVLSQLSPYLSKPVPLLSATKGIEEVSLKLMSEVIRETLPKDLHRSLAVLSGPSFAVEVSKGLPTAVTLVGEDIELVKRLQKVLVTPFLRVYSGTDLIGAQLGGSLKNVMALAAGVIDGLGLGHNTRAALITRGLAEMVRLGTAMGADPRTFYGLSGVGDLVLTCTGPLSRNHSVGVRLGRGDSLQVILGGMQAVAEGVRTSRAALGLAQRYQVDMPIVQEVCAVLFEGKDCRQAVSDLMERSAKDEINSW